LAPYLHKFSEVLQILQFFGAFLEQICIIFGTNSASNFKKLMQKQHLLMVIFGTNLVSIISTKA
jgi:hypothetical protein